MNLGLKAGQKAARKLEGRRRRRRRKFAQRRKITAFRCNCGRYLTRQEIAIAFTADEICISWPAASVHSAQYHSAITLLLLKMPFPDPVAKANGQRGEKGFCQWREWSGRAKKKSARGFLSQFTSELPFNSFLGTGTNYSETQSAEPELFNFCIKTGPIGNTCCARNAHCPRAFLRCYKIKRNNDIRILEDNTSRVVLFGFSFRD